MSGKAAVFFDLDGTLLDSIEDLADSMNAVLERNGLPVHPLESYLYFVGDGAASLVDRALPEGLATSDDARRGFLEEYRTEYAGRWRSKSRLYDGVTEMLDRLVEMDDILLTVLSNKPHLFTAQCVEHFLDGWDFSMVLGQRDEVPRKPDPAGALEIAERLGVPVEDCLFVGDTSVDILTGRAAGMRTVGVLWGFRPESELRDAGAHSVIASPGDLLECLTDV